MYKKVEKIDLFIWGQFVGAVALDPYLGFYVFAYDKKFGKSKIELSPIHIPLNEREKPFVFTEQEIAMITLRILLFFYDKAALGNLPLLMI